jgi:PIN domain nuclease of toxin-antitoxin system
MSAPLLLDTSVLITMAQGQPVRPATRAAILAAVTAGDLWMSAISAWELGLIATRTGRTGPQMGDPRAYLHELIRRTGLKVAPIDLDVAMGSNYLPEPFHSDPADRMLVATARARDFLLITSDRKILAYADAGHVRALAA